MEPDGTSRQFDIYDSLLSIVLIEFCIIQFNTLPFILTLISSRKTYTCLNIQKRNSFYKCIVLRDLLRISLRVSLS